jgi:hypothetical protein
LAPLAAGFCPPSTQASRRGEEATFAADLGNREWMRLVNRLDIQLPPPPGNLCFNLHFFTEKYPKHAKEFAVFCVNGFSMNVRINAYPAP